MKTAIELTREAGGFDASTEFLERLIALARADEREECAKVAENGLLGHTIAKAIRARGNT